MKYRSLDFDYSNNVNVGRDQGIGEERSDREYDKEGCNSRLRGKNT